MIEIAIGCIVGAVWGWRIGEDGGRWASFNATDDRRDPKEDR